MPGTDLAYGATTGQPTRYASRHAGMVLRARFALSGTDIAYSGARSYALSGTDVAYGGARSYARATQCPVLS
eukprot:927976-Rhodomonas_salina.1